MTEPGSPIVPEGPLVLHVMAPSHGGGLERVVEMLAAGQLSLGVHVACVLSPHDASNHPVVRRLVSRGIPTTKVTVGDRNYVHEFRQLRALMKQIGPRLVHTHGYRSDVIGGMAARSARIPVISTVHGFVGGGRRNRVNEAIQCFALGRNDAVIAVSSPIVEQLVSRGVPRDMITLIRNAYAAASPLQTREAARRVLGIDDKAIVAAWVGRLSREKGPDIVLDAIAGSSHSWQLSMIGDGPERDRLRQRADVLGVAHRVTWHGSVSDAASLLGAFDALVLSSRSEGTPIVLLEAMHAGVPIVAAAVGGVPDVVSPNDAILVATEDPDAIARALTEIERRPDAALRRSRAAREKARRSFEATQWVTNVTAVYDAATDRRSHA